MGRAEGVRGRERNNQPNHGHQRQYPGPAQVMPQISREQHLSHDQKQKPDKEQNEVLGHLPGTDHRNTSFYGEQREQTRAGNPKPPPDAATSTPRDQTAQAPHRDPSAISPVPAS